MNYGDIRQYDIANGEGIHCTLFVSGCHFHCQGCFNQEAQDFKYGKYFDKETEDKFIEMCKNENVDAVSILGGEPLDQNDITYNIIDLLQRIKEEVKKPIWLWSGYTYEYLIEHRYTIGKALDYIDVLIDGQFILAQRSLMLNWRGSKNQRVIDVKNSLKQKQVILYCE